MITTPKTKGQNQIKSLYVKVQRLNNCSILLNPINVCCVYLWHKLLVSQSIGWVELLSAAVHGLVKVHIADLRGSNESASIQINFGINSTKVKYNILWNFAA